MATILSQQALEKGAAAAVVRKDELARYAVKTGLLAVADTLVALQTLAAAVRRLWGKPLIGVTGSTGKTTTKEAIAHVLSSRFRVLKSEGNFNNHFGLPLMLLKIEPEHEAAVIEMGMSHRGRNCRSGKNRPAGNWRGDECGSSPPGVFQVSGRNRPCEV